MPKETSAQGLDENFFAAFDELARIYEGDPSFNLLADAVNVNRAKQERGEALTEEDKEKERERLQIFFRSVRPLQPTAKENTVKMDSQIGSN